MSEDQMIEELTAEMRAEIGELAARLKSYKAFHASADTVEGEDRGEVMANMTLAYRHLEDARMRLGKVFQALDGGKSAYKK